MDVFLFLFVFLHYMSKYFRFYTKSLKSIVWMRSCVPGVVVVDRFYVTTLQFHHKLFSAFFTRANGFGEKWCLDDNEEANLNSNQNSGLGLLLSWRRLGIS